jgi:hypothetical protein
MPRARTGAEYVRDMTDASHEAHVESRADLLPEERAAGSEAPEEQARAILEDSLDRTDNPEETRHESTQTQG